MTTSPQLISILPGTRAAPAAETASQGNALAQVPASAEALGCGTKPTTGSSATQPHLRRPHTSQCSHMYSLNIYKGSFGTTRVTSPPRGRPRHIHFPLRTLCSLPGQHKTHIRKKPPETEAAASIRAVCRGWPVLETGHWEQLLP